MRKFKKYWFYLLLALSISLTILVINDINDPLIPKIIQDINSGVIGAILTTIITLILLSNQTESQENLTKSINMTNPLQFLKYLTLICLYIHLF